MRETDPAKAASADRFTRLFDALNDRRACHAIAACIYQNEMSEAERAVARRYAVEFLGCRDQEARR